ncbi:MAG: hypothetical protein Q9168_001112 [Polycauliona sp. 1 TL-2023]
MELQPLLYNASHSDLLTQFASLHIACITHDHTIATFIPPLTHHRINTWWQDRANEVRSGSRDILFVAAPDGSGSVIGVVMLRKPEGETGPFRGMIQKLLVSPDWRRKGVGRALMKSLEHVAREQGKTLLMLDTETGSPAERFYPALGYTKVGIVPNFGISPKDGSLKSETFFYKDLRLSSLL